MTWPFLPEGTTKNILISIAHFHLWNICTSEMLQKTETLFAWVTSMKTWSGKKSKSVFDFLTYSKKTGFSFSYEEVEKLHRPNEPSNEIDRVSKFDNSLSFDAKQNAFPQIFFALWFFKDLFTKNLNGIFLYFFHFV